MTVVAPPVDATRADVAEALIEEARQHQRRRRAWIAAVVILIVLVAGTIAWWASGNASRQSRHSAGSGTVQTVSAGARLRSSETFCDGQVILRPPTPDEHPDVRARITASRLPVDVIGRLPVPDSSWRE